MENVITIELPDSSQEVHCGSTNRDAAVRALAFHGQTLPPAPGRIHNRRSTRRLQPRRLHRARRVLDVLPFEVAAFVQDALPAPPARVLEVGAGLGELTSVLTRTGWVVAIDPAAKSPLVRAVALHELDERAASFDAAVAVISLHRVKPLAEPCRRLSELVRSGGTLIVDEFDVERFDERAARWWLEHGGAVSQEPQTTPRELVADLRKHLHTVDRLRDALNEWFALGEPVRVPYLHRWALPPGPPTRGTRARGAAHRRARPARDRRPVCRHTQSGLGLSRYSAKAGRASSGAAKCLCGCDACGPCRRV